MTYTDQLVESDDDTPASKTTLLDPPQPSDSPLSLLAQINFVVLKDSSGVLYYDVDEVELGEDVSMQLSADYKHAKPEFERAFLKMIASMYVFSSNN